MNNSKASLVPKCGIHDKRPNEIPKAEVAQQIAVQDVAGDPDPAGTGTVEVPSGYVKVAIGNGHS